MDFKTVISRWPSVQEMARELSEERGSAVSANRIYKWQKNNRIPGEYFSTIARAGQKYGITVENLADIAHDRGRGA